MLNKALISICGLLLLTNSAIADHNGFLSLDTGRELYVEHIAAEPQHPTLVLVNGLTHDLSSWKKLVASYKRKGDGIVRIDLYGQGKSLLHYAPIWTTISYGSQVEDIAAVLRALEVYTKVDIAGLSYGGALAIAFGAAFPHKINSVIAMAPYVKPLESQDQWIKQLVQITRMYYPNHPASDEQLYDYFLAGMVYAVYWILEPVLLENPYKLAATFRMAQGIRHFDAIEAVQHLPKNSLHLVVAGGRSICTQRDNG